MAPILLAFGSNSEYLEHTTPLGPRRRIGPPKSRRHLLKAATTPRSELRLLSFLRSTLFSIKLSALLPPMAPPPRAVPPSTQNYLKSTSSSPGRPPCLHWQPPSTSFCLEPTSRPPLFVALSPALSHQRRPLPHRSERLPSLSTCHLLPLSSAAQALTDLPLCFDLQGCPSATTPLPQLEALSRPETAPSTSYRPSLLSQISQNGSDPIR